MSSFTGNANNSSNTGAETVAYNATGIVQGSAPIILDESYQFVDNAIGTVTEWRLDVDTNDENGTPDLYTEDFYYAVAWE